MFDLRMTLEGYFSVDYPENTSIDLDFIHNLQDEIFLKNGILNGLIFQIKEILNPNCKTELEYLIKTDDNVFITDCPKYPAKYYAVFHYLRSLNDDKYILTRNSDDKLKAKELQSWFAELYPTISSQGIYRKLLLIKDSTNQLHSFLKIEMSGERTWKSKIREIATYFNDNKVINELDNY